MLSDFHLRFQRTLPSLRIFENYTTFGEFLADAIGGGEVAALAGGLAFGDEFFDFGVARRRLS